MILKDVTNRDRLASIKDLSKPPRPDPLALDEHNMSFYCGLFPVISNYS